jgi:4'-phosphopantetheinyl transferase
LRLVADDGVSVGELSRRRATTSEVHLYFADLDRLNAYSTTFSETVAADEIAWARQLPTAVLSRRFLRARGFVREVLASYLHGRRGSDLQFDRRCSLCGAQHGKPRLAGNAQPESGIEFSISHSGSLCLIAVSSGPVGVDLEILRDLECEAIARKEFAEAEAESIRLAPPEVRVKAFLELWVRKEALAKALGTGLNREMLTTHVSMEPALTQLGASGSWVVVDVKLGGPTVAAVAAQPQLQTIRLLRATAD